MKLQSHVPEGLFISRSVKPHRGALTGAEGDESGWSQVHLLNKKVNYRCQKNNWWEALNMRDVTAADDQRRILLQAAEYRCDMFQPSSRRRWWNSTDTPLVPNHCRKYCIVRFQLQEMRWGFLREQQRQQEDIFIFRSKDHLKLNRQLVLFFLTHTVRTVGGPSWWGVSCTVGTSLFMSDNWACWVGGGAKAGVLAVCSSTSFWPRHRWHEATQQLTFVGTRLLSCSRSQTHDVSPWSPILPPIQWTTEGTKKETEGDWSRLKETEADWIWLKETEGDWS